MESKDSRGTKGHPGGGGGGAVASPAPRGCVFYRYIYP